MNKSWLYALLVLPVFAIFWWLFSIKSPSPKVATKLHRTEERSDDFQPLPPPEVVKPIQSIKRRPKIATTTKRDDEHAPPHTVVDKEKRNDVRAAIYRAFGRPAPERDRLNPPGTMGSTVDLPGKLDKDYIKNLIQDDFKPLARNCYQDALKRHPELAGKLVVHFTIIGYQDVGGIVEGVNVMDDEGTLHDAELNKCIEDAMLSMAFDAPENGGSVSVTYPFNFSPSRPDGGTKPGR